MITGYKTRDPKVRLCCGRTNIDHLCRLNFDQGLLLT